MKKRAVIRNDELRYFSVKHITVGVLVVFSLLYVTLLRYQNTVLEAKVRNYEVTYPLQVASVGSVYDTKNFSFALTNVTSDKTGTKDYPAPPAMQFVVVDISVHNKLTTSIQFLPIFEVYLEDSSGSKYELTTAPSIEVASIAGEIGPGVATHGRIGFLVPVNANGLRFVYEPKAFPNSHTIVYDIGKL